MRFYLGSKFYKGIFRSRSAAYSVTETRNETTVLNMKLLFELRIFQATRVRGTWGLRGAWCYVVLGCSFLLTIAADRGSFNAARHHVTYVVLA
jgi:hypothetical protein